MTRQVRVEFGKWDGRRHWTFDATYLGEDEYGVWLGLPSGTELDRPDLHLVLDYPSVVLVPRDRWWTAAFNGARPLGQPMQVEVYVDMSTVAEWHGDVVSAVDLDLDVVRSWSGQVELLDEDEFAEHRVELGYPAQVSAAAEQSARECIELLRSGAEPFATVFRGYLARVAGRPSGREAVQAHLAAFNAHDAAHLLAGLAPDASWITGQSTTIGRGALTDVFDDWLWSLDPHLDTARLVADGDHVAAELRETITVDGARREFSIAAFFTVRDGLITHAKIYREGKAEL